MHGIGIWEILIGTAIAIVVATLTRRIVVLARRPSVDSTSASHTYLRRLRIITTSLLAVIALFLSAIWLRSYYCWELASGPIPALFQVLQGRKAICLASQTGRLAIGTFPLDTYEQKVGHAGWRMVRRPPSHKPAGQDGIIRLPCRQSDLIIPAIASCHFMLPTLLTATLATIPWLPWSRRFSLRSLLILMTLVAAVAAAATM